MPSCHHHQQSTHCCCRTCSCNSSCCNSCSSPSPGSASSDHLLQILSAHLLLHQPQPPSPNKPNIPHHHQLQHQHQYKRPHQDPEPDPTDSLLQSLRRRVAALETSTPTPPPSPPPRVTVRDIAARTIQSAFRRFLVRRSRTLRHLKRLAILKSQVATLKSSLSTLHPRDVSHKAMELLLGLDSIQSGDPMIREGRRAITRELTRMVEFVEKVLAREQRMEVPTNEARVGRRVTFDDAEERDEPVSRVFEVEDGEVDWKVGDGEEIPKGFAESVFRNAMNGPWNDEDLGLSPPLPVTMETRRGE